MSRNVLKRSGIQVVDDFLRFSVRSCDGIAEVKVSIVWLAWVRAWVASIAIRLTERVTQGSQRLKLYTDIQ